LPNFIHFCYFFYFSIPAICQRYSFYCKLIVKFLCTVKMHQFHFIFILFQNSFSSLHPTSLSLCLSFYFVNSFFCKKKKLKRNYFFLFLMYYTYLKRTDSLFSVLDWEANPESRSLLSFISSHSTAQL